MKAEEQMQSIKEFQIKEMNDKTIITNSAEGIKQLYDLIDQGEEVIVTWHDNGKIRSQLVFSTNVLGKIKDGSIVIASEEEKK